MKVNENLKKYLAECIKILKKKNQEALIFKGCPKMMDKNCRMDTQ